jgi:HD-GYP domain-containing protein (c-di-GMP phosphodiesterase class II)
MTTNVVLGSAIQRSVDSVGVIWQSPYRSGMAMRNERQPLPLPAEATPPVRSTTPRAEVIFSGATMAERTYLNVVREWGQSIEFGDEYLRGHCSRVAEHATSLATVLGADAEMRTTIFVGAYLHGVGRLRVPRTIQNKPGVLTLSERATIQQIPVWGTEILSKITLPWDVTPIVRWHNERFDGTGYPDALRSDEIPLSAQIVGIANVFDALISPRAHRQALRPSQAVRELAYFKGRWSERVFESYVTQLQSIYSGSLRLA